MNQIYNNVWIKNIGLQPPQQNVILQYKDSWSSRTPLTQIMLTQKPW